MSRSVHRISEFLPEMAARALERLGIGYVDTGGRVRRLSSADRSEPRAVAEKPFAPRVVVVARAHYFETQRTYPVRSRRELLAAIRHDLTDIAPWPDATFLFRVTSTTPGRMRANLWCVRGTVIDHLPALPVLVIPEGVLRAAISRQDFQSVRDPGGAWHLHQSADGMLTSQLAIGLYLSPANLLRAAGLEESKSAVDVTPDPAGRDLLRGLRRIGLADYRGFWVSRDVMSRVDRRRWIRLGVAAGIGGVLYLAAVSVWLNHRARVASDSVSQVRTELVRLSQAETKLNRLRTQYEQLRAPLVADVPRWRVFQLLAEVMTAQDTLERVQVSGNQVELRVLTPSASGLLTRVSTVPEIANPYFANAVQGLGGSEGQERAVIGFEFRARRSQDQQAVVNQNGADRG